MATPARYWLVLAAFAALLYACAGRTTAPLPFVPGASAVLTPETMLDRPDLRRCNIAKAQPGWVFQGACKVVHIPRAGTTVHLPLYAGFTLSLTAPRNDARAGQKITIVDAVLQEISPHAGKPFPQYKGAFLYFKTYDRGRTITFKKSARVTFSLTNSSGTQLGTPCGIARLQSGRSWKTLPVSGTVSGKTLTYAVPTKDLPAIPNGEAYFAFACQTAPTPSPSPSPTTSPTSTPSYCTAFSAPPTPNVPIYITDNSKLGASIVLYVWNGSSWMGANGSFTSPSPNVNAVPLPLNCFPGSTGGAGQTFAVPQNLAASRLYISYTTAKSSSVIPNPLASMPPGGPAPSYGGAYWNVPWDVVELGTTSGAVVDLTAVTNLGLPMEMRQGPPGSFAERDRSPTGAARTPKPSPCPSPSAGPGTIGVTSCNYAKIFTTLASTPQYQNLVATAKFNGKIIDLRIINPAKAQGAWNFGLDWFYNPVYLGPYPAQCSGLPTPLAYGYLSCVLNSYATTPRLYATVGSGVSKVSGDNYCVTSDGSANFGFTDVGSATSCTGITYTSPNMHAMPVALFTYGTPPVSKDGTGCDAGFLFGLPPNNNWITTGKGKHSANVFATPDAFAVWKGLAIDLNRGAALSTNAHPAGGWAQNFASPAAFGNYYTDPLYNTYAYVLHRYYDNHQSYALAYDEPGGQASAFTYVTGDALAITVNPVPTAAAVSPVASPVPYPIPSPCAVLPTNVGG